MSSNNSSDELTDLIDAQRIAIEKKRWEISEIDFQLAAPRFLDNKIYGNIRIEPQSAREMIEHFLLFVNDRKRGEFRSTFNNISIAGFDTTKARTVKVKIQAIPRNSTWDKKESKSHEFSFTEDIRSLNPIINFERSEKDTNANIVVKWHHLPDRTITNYTLMLDKKEIHYVHQRSMSPVLIVYTHNVERGTKHTVQVIGTPKKKKQPCQSDVLNFAVPMEEHEFDMEVLHVRQESLPRKLIAFVDTNEEKPVSPKKVVPTSESVRVLQSTQFRDNALELLEKLRLQIEERRIQHHSY